MTFRQPCVVKSLFIAALVYAGLSWIPTLAPAQVYESPDGSVIVDWSVLGGGGGSVPTTDGLAMAPAVNGQGLRFPGAQSPRSRLYVAPTQATPSPPVASRPPSTQPRTPPVASASPPAPPPRTTASPPPQQRASAAPPPAEAKKTAQPTPSQFQIMAQVPRQPAAPPKPPTPAKPAVTDPAADGEPVRRSELVVLPAPARNQGGTAGATTPPASPKAPVTAAKPPPPPADIAEVPVPTPGPTSSNDAPPPNPPVAANEAPAPPPPPAASSSPPPPPPAAETATTETPASAAANAPPAPPPAAPQVPAASLALPEKPEPAPEQVAALPPEGELKAGDTTTLIFAPSSEKLPSNQIATLDALGEMLNAQEDLKLELQAFAGGDNLSSSQARRLSLSRALTVRNYLMDKGINSTRIHVRALGDKTEEKPINRVDVSIAKRR